MRPTRKFYVDKQRAGWRCYAGDGCRRFAKEVSRMGNRSNWNTLREEACVCITAGTSGPISHSHLVYYIQQQQQQQPIHI